jgi:hypothetical protein
MTTSTTTEDTMASRETMSPDAIDAYLESRGGNQKKFWQIAMGGDMAPLPSSVVQDICDEYEAELHE